MSGNKKKNVIIASIVFAVLVIGAVVGIVFLYKSKNDKDTEAGKRDNSVVEATVDPNEKHEADATTEKADGTTEEAASGKTSTEKTTEKTDKADAKDDKDKVEKTTEIITTESITAETEVKDTSDGDGDEPAVDNTIEDSAEETPVGNTHVHNWVTETYYTTESKVVHHDAVTHVVHHDAVTHTEEQTHWVLYTELGIYELPGCDLDSSECPCPGHHDGYWTCHYCGQTFPTEAAIFRHYDDLERLEVENIATHEDLGNGMHRYTYKDYELQASIEEHLCWGYQGTPGYDDQKLVTETTTVVDKEAYDETIVDNPAWDETVETEVPHTREVCSECGALR